MAILSAAVEMPRQAIAAKVAATVTETALAPLLAVNGTALASLTVTATAAAVTGAPAPSAALAAIPSTRTTEAAALKIAGDAESAPASLHWQNLCKPP